MNPIPAPTAPAGPESADPSRLDYLDATRAFALVLGVGFHACLSFLPVFLGWAVQDVSTTPLATVFVTVSHAFRMPAFFLIAGLLSEAALRRKGARAFIRSRLLRIGVPFVAGWFLLRPLMVSGWIMGAASLRGRVDVPGALLGGLRSLATLPDGLFTGSHLWFLYYLALITGMALAGRVLVKAAGRRHAGAIRHLDALVQWVAECPVSPVILALPTAVALGCMRFWGIDTPDQSLIPHLPTLAVYGGFFVLGWLSGRQRELIPRLTRLTPPRWALAGAGVTAILWLGDIEHDPGHPHFVAAHAAHAYGYALTMWSLTFLMTGIFRKLAPGPNGAVRYVADSSYWMYLVHLPVVVWLQVAVAELPLHWSLKLGFITVVTVGLSLASYDLFVRSTLLGQLLNGRRRERVMMPRLLGLIGLRWGGNPANVLEPRPAR